MYIVGGNQFIKDDEKIDIPILEINQKVQDKQIKDLHSKKKKRKNQLVKKKLQKITDSAKTNENLMPLIIDAALEYATLGEIVDSMKSIFGEWQEKAVI